VYVQPGSAARIGSRLVQAAEQQLSESALRSCTFSPPTRRLLPPLGLAVEEYTNSREYIVVMSKVLEDASTAP